MNEEYVDGYSKNDETRKTRWRATFVVVVTFLFVISAVQVMAAGASAAGTVKKEFIIGMGESVISANPFAGLYDSDYLLYSYIYDYLVFPNEDGIPTPNLATSWFYMNGTYAASHGSDFNSSYLKNAKRTYTPSEWVEGSIWQFNLTQGVKWNDGYDFTADDVVWTANVQTGPNFMSFWAYQPYTRWIHHAEKIDDYTVRFFFADYTPDYTGEPIPAGWVSSMSLPMMPKHMWGSEPASFMAISWKGIPTIGTGPFMGTENLEKEVTLKESITLIKNPWYDYTEEGVRKGLGGVWNRTIEIEQVVMKFYSEEATLILDLKAGKLDASEVTPTNYFALEVSPGEYTRLYSTFSSTVYAKCSHWNVDPGAAGALNPARLDPALWRASQLATNKSKMVDVIFKGLAEPGVGIISPVFPKWYYDAWSDTTNMSTFNVSAADGTVLYTYTATMKDILKFDKTRANAILDAAGYNWTGTPGTSVRKVGQVAAERLVQMGAAGSISAAMYIDGDINKPRTLRFEDIYELEVFEDKETAEYFASEWAAVGIDLVPRPVDVGTWNEMVYGYQYHFTETYWSGDPDPNYLFYVTTSYAMDGWNEWGTQSDVYDELYNNQARGLTFEERDYWAMECQKWQFLDGGQIWTVYPENCYVYNDGLRWTNWGNWTEHPGLAIDHFWGETPLFYRITWVGGIEGGETDWTTIAIAGGAIGAIVVAAAAIVLLRKQKQQKMLSEDEEEEAEATEEKDED